MIWGRTPISTHRNFSQGGFSLLEVLTALLLLIVVMTALSAVVMAVLASASTHRDVVTSGVQSMDIAEQLDRSPYVACQTIAQMRTAMGFPKMAEGSTLDVSNVDYLKSRTAAKSEWVNQGTCVGAGDQGLQRIEVSVTRPRGRGIEKLLFVVRDDTCRNVTTTVSGQEC